MNRAANSPDNYLDNVPSRAVEHEGGDGEPLVLLRPNVVTGILGRWLQSRLPARHFRIKLDEVGAGVWELIDGARTIKEISDMLFDNMGDKVEPRYERVSAFIKSLQRTDMVSLATKNRGQG